jgi:hypothetical protein
MARTCRLVRAGQSADAQWRRDADSLIISPKGAPALVAPLEQVSGLAGDGFTIRLRLPDGELALERLGADGPTLLEELRRDWPALRAAALRLTGGERPTEVFSGNLASGIAHGPFRGFLVGERLIVAPDGGDIVALFVADFASVRFDEETYALRATGWDGGQTTFTRLGGRSAAFTGALLTARERLSRQAASVVGGQLPSLAAGARATLQALWLPGRLLSFDELERAAPGFTESFDASWLTASPRAESGRALMSGLAAGDKVLGYAAPAAGDSPTLWLLAVRGGTASLELLSQGDYATYLFNSKEDIPHLVQGLVRLPEFSREALYLPIEELVGKRGLYAIPARELPLLRDLRERFAGRKIHTETTAN